VKSTDKELHFPYQSSFFDFGAFASIDSHAYHTYDYVSHRGEHMKITEVSIHQVSLPLRKPYKVSFRTYTEFEPILVRVVGDTGQTGWGEAYIPAGSTTETAASGWQFCCEQGPAMLHRGIQEAKAKIDSWVSVAPFAATAMLTALDMLASHPVLETREEYRVPLLAPVSGTTPADIEQDVERLIEAGYRTLKVKVGWEVDDDLARVSEVQRAVAGRARITMDANRGFDAAEARRFAAALDPDGIDLFEQPCEADEWDANAAAALVCPVPLMLDESIRIADDIERASQLPNVKFVKLKLKRIGGIDRARTAMQRATDLGLDVCLGDGVATDLMCWVEACTGRGFLRRAGDMNGFLKPKDSLLNEPLSFENGVLIVKPGYRPEVDLNTLKRHELRRERFTTSMVPA
jgi:L-alanine-DL-glutamate epimerase-like enolase superfamily enzyme